MLIQNTNIFRFFVCLYELLVEVIRNGMVERQHFGAAVVCDHKGNVLESWGDIDQAGSY